VDEGIVLFNSFIADNLNSPLIYSNLGFLYKIKGEFDRALEIYDNGIEKYPENYLLYYRKGDTYQEKGDVESAIQYFKKAIELKPDFPDAYYRLSLAYSLCNKIDEAEKGLKRALELAPEELWLLYYIVSFYEAIKKVEKADEIFGEILRIKDYDQQTMIEYMRFCLRNFLLQKGYEQIQRCLEKNPNNKEVKAELIRYYTLVQSRIQAIQVARELIKEDPEFIVAYQYYALIYENANPHRAIKILTKASQKKEDKWILDKLGRLYMKVNRYKAAVGYFNRALNITPNDPYSLALIGNAYVFLKKYAEAVPYLEKSLNLLKYYPLSYTHYYLANCYFKMDKSIESLKKAEELIKERLELVKRGIAYSKYESFRLFHLLGQIKQRLGNYPEAKVAYSQASKYIFDAPLVSMLSLPLRRFFCMIKERFFSKSSDE
jgi:tetratricopeptide (TPR) repeat protein